MEDKSITTVAAATVLATAGNGKKPRLNGDNKKKKRGAFTLIKAAMFMVRRRSNTKSKSKPSLQVEVASNGMFNKLLGSMRPLHLPDNQSSPPATPAPPPPQTPSTPGMSPLAASPGWASSSSVSSFEGMSQYGSATNLQELGSESPYASSANFQEIDKSESRYASAMDLLDLSGESGDEDDDDDNGIDDNGGDEMIDIKAEEFISQFYKQMRLQHSQYDGNAH